MRSATILIAMTGLLACLPAAAQDITAEQQKLLARRAAEADAYRKLAQVVYGIQLNEHTYVQDFVCESDDIRGDVDAFIKGVRLGTPIFYDDGSCEIPAEVTVAKVIETLRTACDRHYKGSDIKASDFESISRRIQKDVIKVVGMGAPRPDLPPDLPECAMEMLPPAPAMPANCPPPVPDIWKQIGPQARLSAKRAAEMDAMRHLAERIKGLRLTSQTCVRDFVAESDQITAEMQAFLMGAREKCCYFHNNELICECTYVVPTEQVITTIKELHSRHCKGHHDVRGSDIENIVKTVVKKDLEATGMGIPNPRFIQRFEEMTAVSMPGWSMRTLEADGRGTDPQLDSPQGRLRAARAAEMDARRKLAEQIAGLRLESATTVQDFVLQHDEVRGLVDAVVVDAAVTNTRFDDGVAVVTVALPGMSVWDAVNDGLPRPQ
jgi:hypothetical protein